MRRITPLAFLLCAGAPRQRWPLAGLAALVAAVMVLPARAAELGDVVMRSYIGQQLSADIELVALAPDEINNLQVRLARPDVYRGANITMNPALAGVRLTVVRRDQRQFLHIATQQMVDAGHVHVFVELGAAGRQDVRGFTLWLQPDPNPAPLPVAVVAPPPATVTAPAAAVLAPAPAPVAVSPAPSAAALIAARMRAARPTPAPLPELEQAGPLRDLPAPGARVAAPRRLVPVPVPVPVPVAVAVPAAHDKPSQPASVEHGKADEHAPSAHDKVNQPLPVLQAARAQAAPQPPLKAAAKTMSCAPAEGGMTPRECVALDTRNAALSSKLVELESKVRQLQSALQGGAGEVKLDAHASVKDQHAAAASKTSAPAPAAASQAAASKPAASQGGASKSAAAQSAASQPAASQPAASAEAAASTPKRVIRTLPKLKYKKEKPPEQGMSAGMMAAIGAGALALLGGAAWYWLRGRKGGKGGNSGMGRGPLAVWQGWRKKNPVAPVESADAADAAEARVEPQ